MRYSVNYQALVDEAGGIIARNERNAAGGYVIRVRLPGESPVGSQRPLNGDNSPLGNVVERHTGFVAAEFDAVAVLVYCRSKGFISSAAVVL